MTTTTTITTTTTTGHPVHVPRLNKFVRRLHDMLRAEKNGGIVEWRRRGLLVLHNTHLFAKTILPKWFSTRNFKTFRRQVRDVM
jgi:HSF-type DNA-binding